MRLFLIIAILAFSLAACDSGPDVCFEGVDALRQKAIIADLQGNVLQSFATSRDSLRPDPNFSGPDTELTLLVGGNLLANAQNATAIFSLDSGELLFELPPRQGWAGHPGAQHVYRASISTGAYTFDGAGLGPACAFYARRSTHNISKW